MQAMRDEITQLTQQCQERQLQSKRDNEQQRAHLEGQGGEVLQLKMEL